MSRNIRNFKFTFHKTNHIEWYEFIAYFVPDIFEYYFNWATNIILMRSSACSVEPKLFNVGKRNYS